MNHDRLLQTLREDEGLRLKVYADTEGIATVGYGRILQANGIRKDEAELMLMNDTADAIRHARKYPWFERLSDVRQEVVTSMLYQLGPQRFAQFKATIAAIATGDYERAAKQMLASKVARVQAPARWQRHAERMRRG